MIKRVSLRFPVGVLPFCLLIQCLLVPSSAPIDAASFELLSDDILFELAQRSEPPGWPDGGSHAMRVSGDASVVLASFGKFVPCLDNLDGQCLRSPLFFWEEDEVEIVDPLLESNGSQAYAMSLDGLTIVGEMDQLASDGELLGTQPYLWTRQSGIVELGTLEGFAESGASMDVSADGSIVVGSVGFPRFVQTGVGEYQAFRWTDADGMTGLGDLPGGAERSVARAISADGLVVVGDSEYADHKSQAFRWTIDGGMQPLGFFDGSDESLALDISTDGSVILGHSGGHSVRWRDKIGMEDLGEISLYAMSGNGRVAIGTSRTDSVIWDDVNGVQVFADVLDDAYGLGDALAAVNDMSSLALRHISEDGTVIVGFIDGRAFRAEIEPERLLTAPRAGDANLDFQFDQLDLVTVLQAGKYLSGEAATWGEGDWNGLGGSLANPPDGDKVFDQFDVIAALATNVYLTGPYSADQSPFDISTVATQSHDGDVPNRPSLAKLVVSADSRRVLPEPSTGTLVLIASYTLAIAFRAGRTIRAV